MTRQPGLTVFVTLIVTLVGLSRLVELETGAPRLLLDPSVNSMLPAKSEASQFYARIRDQFGNDERLVLALTFDELFTSENLGQLLRVRDRVAELDGVRQVDSVASLLGPPPVPTSDPESAGAKPAPADPTEQSSASGVIPEDPAELALLRGRALANPLVAGSLVSLDARTAALVVEFEDLSEQEIFERGLDTSIEEIARDQASSAQLWVTGGVRVKAEMTRLLMRDLTLIVPVAIFVMAAMGFLSFRTGRGVFVPLSTIAVSTIALLAIMAESVGSLNQVTVAVPPILIVVGFAYTVHVLSAYYDSLRSGHQGRDAVRDAVDHVALPVLLTGVTTCAGFASLATSSLPAIQQFGLFTALGVALTTLASLTYAPAILALLPSPRRLPHEPGSGRFDALVEAIARFDVLQRRKILWAAAGIAALSLVGMTRIEVSTDLIENFDPESKVRRDFQAFNTALGGANAFYVVLESAYRGSFETPSNLRTLKTLQEWLESHSDVGGTTSLVDYLEVASTSTGGEEGAVIDRIEAGTAVEDLVAVLPADGLRRVVDPSFRTANIVVRTSAIDSADIARLVEDVEAHFAELPRNVIPAVTGNTVLMARTVDAISLGQALSLGTAFLIIFGILILLFASLRAGFIALVPNVLPVLFYFGLLGWSGITLNTTTGLVAALVLGIAVDDTIHYMTQFNIAAKRHADTRKGVVEALRSVIRPVTYTTASLCLGFSTLMLSNLRNQVEFGLLAAATLAFAWLVDITFTPALAARMRVVTLWDILSLDLGPEPQRAIPLFAGLRETQARVVALLARIQHIHKGHPLMEFGAEGEGMYIVIDGEIELSVPRDGEALPIQVARRGDTLGEGALFHGRRIANAVALTNARLLLLTEEDLGRLREQYPRIATQVYLNLSRILAVQLTLATGLVVFPPETETGTEA